MSRLVIRAPNWVGDLCMATAVFDAAGRESPWDEVHILVRDHLPGLLDSRPYAAEVHPIRDPLHERRLLSELAPDAALLLSTSFRCAWLAWRAGVPLRAGAATAGRRFLLTHAVRPPTVDGRRALTPTAHLYRDVAGLFGIGVSDLHPRLGATPQERERVRAAVGTAEPYLLVCPGAAFGAAKLWPPERFAAALDALHAERGLAGVVVGAPAEEPLVQAVVRAATSGPRIARVDLGGLRALVAEASLVLVGDSGPRWIAAAFDVPCVSVMGPNSPTLTATSLERARIVRRTDLECSPCLERRCPLGHHACLAELAVEDVVRAALELCA